MNRPRSERHRDLYDGPLKSLAGWLATKGSSLGPHLSSIEEALELGAISPRSCLHELTEEQAETVRRLALASLLAVLAVTTEEEAP